MKVLAALSVGSTWSELTPTVSFVVRLRAYTPMVPGRSLTTARTSCSSVTARGWHVPPIPAEERPPTDRDWTTAELPDTPQRFFLIPAERWIEAPAELRSLGADLGIEL